MRLVALWANSSHIEESYKIRIYPPSDFRRSLHGLLIGHSQLQISIGTSKEAKKKITCTIHYQAIHI